MALEADISQGMRQAPVLNAQDIDGGSAFGRVLAVKASDGKRAFVGGPDHPDYRKMIPPPEPDPWPDVLPEIETSSITTSVEPVTERPVRVSGAKRIVVYTARNDQFAIVVEEAPDWEPVSGCSFKTDAQAIEKIVEPLCRGLGVKFIDKTAGDLEEAMEAGNPKPTPIRRTRARSS